MFISHKSNVIQHIHVTEWQCRMLSKGLTKPEYWAWLDSVSTVTGTAPDEKTTVDLSGETGYTIVKCTDEDVNARLIQLSEYVGVAPEGTTYNIKWQDDIGDAEEILGADGKSQDPKVYVQSHFVGDDSAKVARLLSDEWTNIRRERDRLLANSDWTQGGDTPLTSAKKTSWATYRTKLRDVPKDQKDKTTYASITWPSEPS